MARDDRLTALGGVSVPTGELHGDRVSRLQTRWGHPGRQQWASGSPEAGLSTQSSKVRVEEDKGK